MFTNIHYTSSKIQRLLSRHKVQKRLQSKIAARIKARTGKTAESIKNVIPDYVKFLN
jgi:hypothetical protein